MSVTGYEGCYCRSLNGHERTPYPGHHCTTGTVVPGWQRHEFKCSRGHDNHKSTNVEWQLMYPYLQRTEEIDIASAAADLYILEAIAYDVANPRPFTVTDITGINLDQVSKEALLKMIGVTGPKKVGAYIETHVTGEDTLATLIAQYDKWKDILAPNVPLNSSLRNMQAEAHEILNAGTDVLAQTLREYMHYAAVSELSYHHRFAYAFDGDVGVVAASAGWYDFIQHTSGGIAARSASALFRDKTKGGKKAWGSSYGGQPWAQATDVLGYFEDGKMGKKPFNAKLFCDRMFALQHNTGSILNKVTWSHKGRGFASGYNVGSMQYLLDAHHNSDWYKLEKVASVEVSQMLQTYWTITNREFVRAGLEPQPFPNQSPVYGKSTSHKKKPDYSIVVEKPSLSNKAQILLAGSHGKVKGFKVPKKVLAVGNKVVNKPW